MTTTTKIFGSLLIAAFALAVVLLGAGISFAQTATFPAGCSSALGYSVTTGLACNGTATATIGPLPGCTTALGYSITTGAPCSGGPIAINFLAGCSSIYGYSIITGAPCNGTTVATAAPSTPVPTLPTTGAGADAVRNALMLMASGMIATFGLTRFARRNEI